MTQTTGQILVEDTVDAYGDSAAAFLETEIKNIETQDKTIRIAAGHGNPGRGFHEDDR